MHAMARPKGIPSYRLHKASGNAVLTLNGRDVHLGAYGSDASRREYHRRIAEWMAGGGASPRDKETLTIKEVADAFLAHAPSPTSTNGERRKSNPHPLIAP